MIRLQILSGKQAGQNVLVRRFPFRIGRSGEAGLCLSDQGVWEDHCRLEYRAKAGFFVAATPGARTLVNDAPVEGDQRLTNAAEISLGAVRLRFNLDDPVPRRLGPREAVTWLFLGAVIVGELWLIWWLPR